jgi:hypothetical protein
MLENLALRVLANAEPVVTTFPEASRCSPRESN